MKMPQNRLIQNRLRIDNYSFCFLFSPMENFLKWVYPDLQHFPPSFFRMYCMGVHKFYNLLDQLAPRLWKKAAKFLGVTSP